MATLETPEPGLVTDALMREPRTHFRHTVDVGKGRSVTLDYYYITKDDEIPHLYAWAKNLKVFGYDVETGGLDAWTDPLATIQIGNPVCRDPRAYTIDVRCVSREALEPILELLKSKRVKKLGMNVGFEYAWTKKKLEVGCRNLADVQVTELCLRAGLFKAKQGGRGGDRAAYGHTKLENLCKFHLGIQIDKAEDIRLTFASTPPGMHSRRHIIYANGDVVYPFYVAAEQRPEVEARGLKDILRIENELIPVVKEAELFGIGIDAKLWNRLWQTAVEAMDQAERDLDRKFLEVQGGLLFGNNEFCVPARLCKDCDGSGEIRANEDCKYCGGTGTIAQQEMRPVYLAASKPKPINWSSAPQVRWALARYCDTIGWPIKVVTTYREMRKLKLGTQKGREWMEKKGLTEQDLAFSAKDEKAGLPMIPDWVLDEKVHCLLVDAGYDTLRLRKLRGQLPADFVDLLLAYADQKSLTTTFGKDYLKNRKADGRIHVEFHQLIAETGRMSSSPNLQNIPRDQNYRAAFKPRPGYAFVIADYSQIEPRISAQVSKDPTYMANYLAGGDLYITIAEQMSGMKVDKHTPEGKEMRSGAKSTTLGLSYRMGVWKLRDKLTLDLNRPVSYEEAEAQWNGYLRACSGIQQFQEDCEKLADPNSETCQQIWDPWLEAMVTYIQSPCGRIRFFSPDAKSVYTQACNHPIQGLSATITKAAACLIQRHIDDEGVDAIGVNFVHDEIVYECRADQAEAFALTVKKLMEQAGQYYLPDVPVIAEFPEGSNGVVPFWAKEFTTPAKLAA